MNKLIAVFTFPLDQYLFVKRISETEVALNSKLDLFDVEIRLVPYKKGLTVKRSDEDDLTYCISEIVLNLSKVLSEEIPAVGIIGTSEDYSQRSAFFLNIMRDYQNAALAAINRILGYFKYILKNPLLESVTYANTHLYSVKWFGDDGKEIKTGIHSFHINNPPGLGSHDFGIRPLKPESVPDLQRAIENEIVPELHEYLLANAQSAIFQGNYRRAVLEMAMTCELAIKQTYFSKTTAAGRAYEFMEDRQKISMNITDYIDGVAEFALGETFLKATSKADFLNIQHLFRGRNKIVHRGDLAFRDDKNKEHRIDRAVLVRWWISVEKLLSWLQSKKSAR